MHYLNEKKIQINAMNVNKFKWCLPYPLALVMKHP